MSLPDNPHLDHLRRQARELQRAVRAGDPAALARVEMRVEKGAYPLHLAQRVVARSYGFASWARLKRYVDLATEHGWQPLAEPPGTESPENAFCRWACLVYAPGDGPERWQRAEAILAEHPERIAGDIWAAAAAGLGSAVRTALRREPGLARAAGGPYQWGPLCYLAYSRVVAGSREETIDAVRALLAAGADPGEGHLWNGQPYPFTVLTGFFGHGELGRQRQPEHPHGAALARLVLDAGADANDSQTLYNRMFATDDSHLRLLFEYGLGRGDGGPWRRRLGDEVGSPAELLRDQLRWAVEHGMAERVRLLVAHGVDVVAAYPDGRTPVDLARLGADGEIAEILAAAGAPRPRLDEVDRLIADLFDGREPGTEAAVEDARRRRPGLIVWAAARGRHDVVAALAGLGWDVNARGRGDVPVEEEWQTALHEAAGGGDLAMIDLLLSLGADRTLRDARFDATPLDWARHEGRHEAARRLE